MGIEPMHFCARSAAMAALHRSAGLALFAAHAVLNKFFDAARACTGVGRVTALPGD
jgi:hypothetical protein